MASDPPVKPAAKRSLFNKPAWSVAQTSGDAVDFFSRSKQRYTDIVKEQEDRRRKRRDRLAKQRGRNAGEDDEGGREGKRRRVEVGSEDDGDDDTSIGSDPYDEGEEVEEREAVRRKTNTIALEHSDDDNSRPPPPPPENREESGLLSKRDEDVLAGKQSSHHHVRKPVSAAPIEISDNEDADEPIQIQQSIQRQHYKDDEVIVTDSMPKPREDQDSVSDEEYPELARLARERARSKQLQSISSNGPPSALSPLSPAEESRLSSLGTNNNNFHLPSPPAIPDAKINILITSSIADTNPLIVQRKLSQPLKDVRLAWCTRQNFDQETIDSIFLTWRGKRLFDVTTCKSLGIGVDVDGNVVTKGENDSLGEENRQIHMEAMTQEILDEVRKARENAGSFHHATTHNNQTDHHKTMDNASVVASSHHQPLSQQQQQPPQKEQQIRVILQSKGFDDFKLIIKPTTKISRIQSAFRQARKVDPARDVFLMFDGERLSPDDTVADTEINDLDHLDVHVK